MIISIGARKRRVPGNTIFSQPYRRRVSTDRLNRKGSQLATSLEGEPGPTPAGKTLPHSYPETRFRSGRYCTMNAAVYCLYIRIVIQHQQHCYHPLSFRPMRTSPYNDRVPRDINPVFALEFSFFANRTPNTPKMLRRPRRVLFFL